MRRGPIRTATAAAAALRPRGGERALAVGDPLAERHVSLLQGCDLALGAGVELLNAHAGRLQDAPGRKGLLLGVRAQRQEGLALARKLLPRLADDALDDRSGLRLEGQVGRFEPTARLVSASKRVSTTTRAAATPALKVPSRAPRLGVWSTPGS